MEKKLIYFSICHNDLISTLFFYFLYLIISKSSAAELLYVGKGYTQRNHLRKAIYLNTQHMLLFVWLNRVYATFNSISVIIMENIVSKGEIARFVQFLLLSLCFQHLNSWIDYLVITGIVPETDTSVVILSRPGIETPQSLLLWWTLHIYNQ